nr:MAG TPA: hypothetical protein [Caudoviricetes sp.]
MAAAVAAKLTRFPRKLTFRLCRDYFGAAG